MGAHIRTGLILLMLGFVMVRVGTTYMYSYQFQKLVERELEGAGRLHPEVGRLHASILDQSSTNVGARTSSSCRPLCERSDEDSRS